MGGVPFWALGPRVPHQGEHMTIASRTTGARWGAAAALAAVLGLVLALLLVVPAGAAPAQTPGCDPTYGCTTTTAPPPSSIVCQGQITGTPGGPQSVIITDGPPDAVVQVVFNGNTIASGETDGQGNATVAFQLPIGVEGSYVVLVAGAGFNASCDPPVHWDGGGVAGVSQGNGSGGGGLLAFTGFHLFLWLLIAAALVALGAGLRRAASRRRRFAPRA